jgi:hypothetical protein
MSDIHCFEVTEAIGMITYVSRKMRESEHVDSKYSFLPAKRTWLEYRQTKGWTKTGGEIDDPGRIGFLLVEDHDKMGCECFIARWQKSTDLSWSGGKAVFGLRDEVSKPALAWNFYEDGSFEAFPFPEVIKYMILASLAVINTPKIVGRRTFSPNKALQKALINKRPIIGHFPLHGYTEIKLDIGVPKDASNSKSNEVRLTGEKCLHFCRSHIRVRLGRLEIVSGHWRGDASLGIKQSRYVLTNRRSNERRI